MKEEVKEKWLHALRSGNYKQGVGRLRTDDEFCCLGVLCDLYPEGYWREGKDEEVDGVMYTYRLSKDPIYERIGFPQSAITHLWAEIPSDFVDNLAGMNDNGKSFEEIADVIEKEV